VSPDATVDPKVAPFITPNNRFYRIDTAFSSPRIDLAEWRLRIGGQVDRPLTLTFDDLLDRHVVERVVTLCCVSNEVGGDLIGTARWLGVPLAELLREASPHTGADQIAMTSADGWTCGFPTEIALDGRDAMVVVGMNGEPLPIDHGFPVRVVVPGLYGYVSATKWVTRIELTTRDAFDGYWVPLGWSKDGPVKTQSRIDVPKNGDDLRAGRRAIAGVAWAQHRGIRRVEVRVDDQPWAEARVGSDVSDDTWRQWIYEWDATPGSHKISVRATDGTGETQTGELAPPAPDGATGWHTIRVGVG
jgi:DMSO/TMAO reductase YedYZ molybdopterin-dependent catalytic subunit